MKNVSLFIVAYNRLIKNRCFFFTIAWQRIIIFIFFIRGWLLEAKLYVTGWRRTSFNLFIFNWLISFIKNVYIFSKYYMTKYLFSICFWHRFLNMKNTMHVCNFVFNEKASLANGNQTGPQILRVNTLSGWILSSIKENWKTRLLTILFIFELILT